MRCSMASGPVGSVLSALVVRFLRARKHVVLAVDPRIGLLGHRHAEEGAERLPAFFRAMGQQPFGRQSGDDVVAPAVEIVDHPGPVVEMVDEGADHGAAHEFCHRAAQECLDIVRREDRLADRFVPSVGIAV